MAKAKVLFYEEVSFLALSTTRESAITSLTARDRELRAIAPVAPKGVCTMVARLTHAAVPNSPERTM